MTNHYHLAVETPECTLSTGMHRFLGRYVQIFNKRHKRRGHLFQERYKNVLVEEESQGLVLSSYIVLNPVKAGMVSRPEEWNWSSYNARAGLATCPPWLTIDPLLSQLGPDRESQQQAWREFVLERIDEKDDLLDHAVAGIYLGTASWIDRIQSLLDEKEQSEDLQRAQVHPGRPGARGRLLRSRRIGRDHSHLRLDTHLPRLSGAKRLASQEYCEPTTFNV